MQEDTEIPDKRFDSTPKSKGTHVVRTHERKLKDGRIIIIPSFLRSDPDFNRMLDNEQYYEAAMHLWDYRKHARDDEEDVDLQLAQRELLKFGNKIPAKQKWKKKKRSELESYSELVKHVWVLEGGDYEVRIYNYSGHYEVDLWKLSEDEYKVIGGENWAEDAKKIAEEFMAEENDLDKFWQKRRAGFEY